MSENHGKTEHRRAQNPTGFSRGEVQAKTNLSALVDRAARGEEIVIAKAGRPVAKLAPLRRRTTPRPLGLLRGEAALGEDFDAPLPDSVMQAFLSPAFTLLVSMDRNVARYDVPLLPEATARP